MNFDDWIAKLYMRHEYTREELARAAWEVAKERAEIACAAKCSGIAARAKRRYEKYGEQSDLGAHQAALECKRAIDAL